MWSEIHNFVNMVRLKYLVRKRPGAIGQESVNKESSDQRVQKLLNMLHRYLCNTDHLDLDNLDRDADEKEVNDDARLWQH